MNAAVILRADRACRYCRGRGYIIERHAPGFEEHLECDCPFHAIPDSDAAAVERGEYVVLSADEADGAGG